MTSNAYDTLHEMRYSQRRPSQPYDREESAGLYEPEDTPGPLREAQVLRYMEDQVLLPWDDDESWEAPQTPGEYEGDGVDTLIDPNSPDYRPYDSHDDDDGDVATLIHPGSPDYRPWDSHDDKDGELATLIHPDSPDYRPWDSHDDKDVEDVDGDIMPPVESYGDASYEQLSPSYQWQQLGLAQERRHYAYDDESDRSAEAGNYDGGYVCYDHFSEQHSEASWDADDEDSEYDDEARAQARARKEARWDREYGQLHDEFLPNWNPIDWNAGARVRPETPISPSTTVARPARSPSIADALRDSSVEFLYEVAKPRGAAQLHLSPESVVPKQESAEESFGEQIAQGHKAELQHQKRKREDSVEFLYEFQRNEEHFTARPSIKLPVPDHIKAMLVDDWENITKNNQLVPVPHPHPVEEILNDYLAYERPNREEGSANMDILEEVVAGLREYFDKCLSRILLYRFERIQYHEIRKVWEKAGENDKHKSVCDTYGAEHLCRLMVSLPELVAQTNMDQQSVSRLREELSKLTVWLGKNAKNYFVDTYETPSPEYIDKAKGF
ncbi:Chromatin modification-related protein eaf3 [Colletotrichum sidae]|uniref:Chromatin modification-related protein EAF3 n=1 Tax=Colletotrichum sidae TaxID=1347389 RepID=A0A4R8TIZ6_9PEZI|nr:Chromatin modification-related protein eaf3 [Colletotrichum sidae]